MIVDKIKKRQVPTNNKTSNIDIPKKLKALKEKTGLPEAVSCRNW